jgi:hypothetical protein
MGCKNQKCACSVRKMQVLNSSENFGQGFRRGRRKMGFKKSKMHLYWEKNASPGKQRKFWPGLPRGVDEKWVLRIQIAPVLC